jgi:hypothetical protein
MKSHNNQQRNNSPSSISNRFHIFPRRTVAENDERDDERDDGAMMRSRRCPPVATSRVVGPDRKAPHPAARSERRQYTTMR